jgi:hypothetical protein
MQKGKQYGYKLQGEKVIWHQVCIIIDLHFNIFALLIYISGAINSQATHLFEKCLGFKIEFLVHICLLRQQLLLLVVILEDDLVASSSRLV